MFIDSLLKKNCYAFFYNEVQVFLPIGGGGGGGGGLRVNLKESVYYIKFYLQF